MPGLDVFLINRFERSALDGVAAVNQQVVRIFGARVLNQGRDLGQASVDWPGGVIVVRQQVAVEIGSGQY